MRLAINLILWTIIGGVIGLFIGWCFFPEPALPTDNIDSMIAFFFQFGGAGLGSILGFIIGGGLSSRREN